MTNCEPEFPGEAARDLFTQARLLRGVERVLVVGIAIPAWAEPIFVPWDGITDHRGTFDACLLADIENFPRITPLLSAYACAYIVPPASNEELIAHGLTAYVAWDGMVMAVRCDYDPVAHARHLLHAGHPNWAYELLMNIPEGFFNALDAKAAVAAEKQWCLLALSRDADAMTTLNRFYREQEQFFIATTYAPFHIPSYACHARFWQRLGRQDMAHRLLKTIQVFEDAPIFRQMLTTLDPRPVAAHEDTPPPAAPDRGLRVLIITPDQSDYGVDTLYDGLCSILGDDAVVEFPWKPTLHGQTPERAEGYPCTFNRRGAPCALEKIGADLQERTYNLVLFADTLKVLDRSIVRWLAQCAGDLPFFILDTWDEGGDYQAELLDVLGRDTCRGYFKREMLAGVPYAPNTYPLPFSYSPDRVPRTTGETRRADVFWAGKPAAGLRPLYVHWLESFLGRPLQHRYTPDDYAKALGDSLIGLNLFGYGFDTVRYWEIPAHGAMLLSERPPIVIPHNFEDGVHAVFFDDLPDLHEKLLYYLRHPKEAAAIAAAGKEHFLRYHTTAARAQQVLDQVHRITRSG